MKKIFIKRYLSKKKFKFNPLVKYTLFYYFSKKPLLTENDNVWKNYTYFPIVWKNHKILFFILPFNAYQTKAFWIKNKYNNFKYHKLLFNIKENLLKLKNPKKTLTANTITKLFNIFNYIYTYNYFFYSIYTDLFYFTKINKYFKNKLNYLLILSFKKNKIFINFKNLYKKNYLFLSSGLFIKFFEKKKAFKKNKTIKLLMAKYIRKLFLISKIKSTILFIKKNPILLSELVNFLNKPIAHKFLNPIENKIIEETDFNFLSIKFPYFIFLHNKSFCINKNQQKGRIKRKILRKIVFGNKIID